MIRWPFSRKPKPLRDESGRYVSSHRRAVRSKAISMALDAGRPDLAERLEAMG
ncbi:MAG TPA: hypothetical protein PKD48_01790 [Sphingopyxis sp.]|nr:hypothetical protein [Sphingopyxis sp.]